MQYFIAAKGLDRILNKSTVKYHAKADCAGLVRFGSAAIPISEQEIIDAAEFAKPCLFCVKDHRAAKKPASKSAATNGTVWPQASIITVWNCSDGREFTKETEALWYELSLAKKRLSK